MKNTLAALMFLGCSQINVQRQSCYATAEAEAAARAQKECPDSWSECERANDIMNELKLKQEGCP